MAGGSAAPRSCTDEQRGIEMAGEQLDRETFLVGEAFLS
jgi:hypothetical protein